MLCIGLACCGDRPEHQASAQTDDAPAQSPEATTTEPTEPVEAPEPEKLFFDGKVSSLYQEPAVLGEDWKAVDRMDVDDPNDPPRDEQGQLIRRGVAMADAMLANEIRSMGYASFGPVKDEGFSPLIVGMQVVVYQSTGQCEAQWKARLEVLAATKGLHAIPIPDVADGAWRYDNDKMPKLAVRKGNVWLEADATGPTDAHARLLIAYLKALAIDPPTIEHLLKAKADAP